MIRNLFFDDNFDHRDRTNRQLGDFYLNVKKSLPIWFPADLRNYQSMDVIGQDELGQLVDCDLFAMIKRVIDRIGVSWNTPVVWSILPDKRFADRCIRLERKDMNFVTNASEQFGMCMGEVA